MDTEKIIIDIPLLEEKAPPKKKRNIIPIIAAVLLSAASVVLHSAVAAGAVEYIKNEGSELLFKSLIPEYKISEPLTPDLPEGDSIQGEEGEGSSEDKQQTQFLIRDSDLSAKAENGLVLTNETSYSPDLYQLLGAQSPSMTYFQTETVYGEDCPKVLIYHTHATEGYAECAGTGFRTTNEDKNMIAVGRTVCEVLETAGIETIHLTQQFDRDDWSAAYDNSNAAVRQTLKENPSVQYVFDLHRDCIGNDTEGYVRATTEVFGYDTAQLMFVCGTDEGGSSHESWRNNLSSALKLQSSLWNTYEGIVRPVNLRRASFYQDTSPSSLLLECGTCAGTLDEAKRAAVLFASALADYIKGEDCGLDEEELIKTLCP